MVQVDIGYHRRSQNIRIVDNPNSNRYIADVLKPEVAPNFQRFPGATFQQDNAQPHVAKNDQTFFYHNRYCFFLDLPIHRICCLLFRTGILFVCVSLLTPSRNSYTSTLCLNESNLGWYSLDTYSKSVTFDTTTYRNAYTNAWWLHHMLIFHIQYLFFFYVNLIIYLSYTGHFLNNLHSMLIITLWCF